MAQESTVIVGSGINPLKSQLGVNHVTQERHLRGSSVVVLNPEDASAGIGGAVTKVTTVSGVPTQLPSAPLTYRRAIAIRNNSNTGVLYVGFTSGVTVNDGYPLDAGESFPLEINTDIRVWGIADSALDIRIIEVA